MSVPDKSIDPRLLASAKAEFLKQGFLRTELKTICKNANITTGAVYKRYILYFMVSPPAKIISQNIPKCNKDTAPTFSFRNTRF